MFFRQERRRTAAGDLERMQALSSTAMYEAGDLETDAEYYRFHFRATIRQPEQLERVVKSLRANVTPEGIRKARAIEDRLYAETWLLGEYNLLPRLNRLTIPALVIRGDYDFVPLECAVHIAQAIPGARFVRLRECGHFSYIESPDEVHKEICDFLH
jgi:proline iminopeptidase